MQSHYFYDLAFLKFYRKSEVKGQNRSGSIIHESQIHDSDELEKLEDEWVHDC